MNNINSINNIIILLCVTIVILFIMYYNLYNEVEELKKEQFVSLSNESLQILASVYNGETLTVKNINVIDSATIQNATVTGTTTLKDTQINGNATMTGNIATTGEVTGGNATFANLVSNGTVKSTGLLTVTGGSSFSGSSHLFTDGGSANKLRVGSAYGVPGISADSGEQIQIQDFTVGTQKASTKNTAGMVGLDGKTVDQNYCYLKSRLPSYGLINNTNTGNFGMAWNNKELYWTWLSKNERWNTDIGHLPYL